MFLLSWLCQVQGVSEAVKTTKGIRKGVVWPLISFTIVMVIFLLIALGIYSIFACSVNNCVMIAKLITPCSIFLALIIWLSAAAAISMGGERTLLPYRRCYCQSHLLSVYSRERASWFIVVRLNSVVTSPL